MSYQRQFEQRLNVAVVGVGALEGARLPAEQGQPAALVCGHVA